MVLGLAAISAAQLATSSANKIPTGIQAQSTPARLEPSEDPRNLLSICFDVEEELGGARFGYFDTLDFDSDIVVQGTIAPNRYDPAYLHAIEVMTTDGWQPLAVYPATVQVGAPGFGGGPSSYFHVSEPGMPLERGQQFRIQFYQSSQGYASAGGCLFGYAHKQWNNHVEVAKPSNILWTNCALSQGPIQLTAHPFLITSITGAGSARICAHDEGQWRTVAFTVADIATDIFETPVYLASPDAVKTVPAALDCESSSGSCFTLGGYYLD